METEKPEREQSLGVAVKAALVRRRRVLIVQRSDSYPSAPGMWEFCGGRMEPGEHPLDALVREVREEAGLDCHPTRPLYVDNLMRPAHRQVIIICFLAQAGPGEVRLSYEHKDSLWATQSQARQLLGPGIVRNLLQHGVFPLLDIDP